MRHRAGTQLFTQRPAFHPFHGEVRGATVSADVVNSQDVRVAGITEEIRSQLSQIAALRLLSRDGLDAYRDDAARAAQELGLRHLVDGSVRVEGNRVRVSAELVDASTRQTLWSEQYDRDLADVLTVQSQIAQ
jgi:adenylate cyclase